MAQLSSPGVSVSVIDESFYTSAAPGTVPLIFVATEENKRNGASTGTARGTLKANAGKVYLITSQKDLTDTFGTPKFITDGNNNPVHAGEQNEYGLQAAYSFLGVSNRAYVVRADVDLAQLSAMSKEPTGNPANNTFWLSTNSSKYGIFKWNGGLADTAGGQTFANVVPVVINNVELVDASTGAPNLSYGAIGTYAIVTVNNLNTMWYKKPMTKTPVSWVAVGSQAWIASSPTVRGSEVNVTLVNEDTLVINGVNVTNVTTLDALVAAIGTSIPGVTAALIDEHLELYSSGVSIELSGSTVGKAGLGFVGNDGVVDLTPIYNPPALAISKHTQVPSWKRTGSEIRPSGSLWIKTTSYNLGANWDVKKFNAQTKSWQNLTVPLYANNAAALAAMDAVHGGINLAGNTVYVKYNDEETAVLSGSVNSPAGANFKIYRRRGVGQTSITSIAVISQFATGAYDFRISETLVGSPLYSPTKVVSFNGTGVARDAATIVEAINNIGLVNVVASLTPANKIVITHKLGGDIKFSDGAGAPIASLFGAITDTRATPTTNLYGMPGVNATEYYASLWTSLTDDNLRGFVEAATIAPVSGAVNGQLWYNTKDEADILINNGSTWVGYQFHGNGTSTFDSPYYNATDSRKTDPNGPIWSASKPTTQSDGTPLVEGDLWIDMTDEKQFPAIYKFQDFPKIWKLVDSADQTTENGILFHDARWSISGEDSAPAAIEQLLHSDFLDPDAPDPALYPKGMLLWNLRRSGWNVKRSENNHIDLSSSNYRYGNERTSLYNPHRWVSEAANQENGAGTFGRLAQRKVVVQKLQALVNSNQSIRDEEGTVFNLLATPGYPELVGEMVSLNYDRGLTAFVVADTPSRLTPDATSLSNWGRNIAGALEDNDHGIASFDEYAAFFYPWGYTSDNIGNNIVVPPSHMMLRTIALNDQVAYPWFAPAGTRRGGITNATAVGYVDAEGEFKSVALNTGQRDTLASVKVNAITFINGSGLVNYAQYTRARNASALDRINVARLVVYLRRQFDKLAKPYLFEPNDVQTRNQIKAAAESLLLEIVGQRGIYDYIVVCDESNNTPARIDRNELYLDVAIEPVKSVEFIYIPLRLKNTGEIKGLG